MPAHYPHGGGRPVAGRRSSGDTGAVPKPLRDALTAGLIDAADMPDWRARWHADADGTVVALAALIPEETMPDPAPTPPAALVAALHGQTDLAVYAMAAAAARPWGDRHPVLWAVATGRITVEGAAQWQQCVEDNPDVGLPVLAALEPVLGPRLANLEAALAASDPEEDELAEFDRLQPPNWRVRKPEEDDVSEFEHLFPPNTLSQPQDALDPEFAEFEHLFPPNMRLSNRARLGGH